MSPDLDASLRRLRAALDTLETALARRQDLDEGRGNLETELQLMQDDRFRLATELDGATARLARVEAATAGVEGRVARAVGLIHAALGEAETAEIEER